MLRSFAIQRSLRLQLRRYSAAATESLPQPRPVAKFPHVELPARHSLSVYNQERYWQKIPIWRETTTDQFLSHKWQMGNTVQSEKALVGFLKSVLPTFIPPQVDMAPHLRITDIQTPEQFIQRLTEGIQRAPMAVRLSPHILSSVNWQDPINDPIRRQFIPLSSPLNVNHPKLLLDPLQETEHSPVPGLVHRYYDKALFLSTSICPIYCRFCVRSYSVGNETETVKKMRFLPVAKKWEPRFQYIEATPHLQDIVISGGDTYLLEPGQVRYIGERLLSIPHVRRFRFASKGLGVSPSRLLDPQDRWVDTIIDLDKKARRLGKHVCIHTHFNSTNEISWISKMGAQRLYENNVTVRNQTVLLNGVNNKPEEMLALIRALGDMNIQPYYVYQGDSVPGAEDLRTPMRDSLELERAVRGKIAGFLIPSFIVDLPGEGGKRLTRSVESYDRHLGLSRLTAPGSRGEMVTFDYWDPLWSLSDEGRHEILARFSGQESPSSQ